MIYKTFKDKKLSHLGLGAMRLPTISPGGPIDEKAAVELMEYAHTKGINYIDTGYFYHGGESESFVGQALRRFPQGSWYLANKMPGNILSYEDGKLKAAAFNTEARVFDGVADIFQYQLNKCGVDKFEFYLFHNVNESSINLYTNEEIGIVDYLIAQKKAGYIEHLGFSAHGRAENIESFLNYLEARNQLNEIEFGMIQLNYLDWTLQDAAAKYNLLTKRGIPVFVMEPLRGGKLCNLQGEAAKLLAAANPQATQASWAFRYVQSLPNIPVVLSGMSSMSQLKENLALFENIEQLTASEHSLLKQVADTIVERVPCTLCRYCVDVCPKQLDIPLLLTLYNEANFDMFFTVRQAIQALGAGKRPDACSACNLCKPLCPQDIDIPAALKSFTKLLN